MKLGMLYTRLRDDEQRLIEAADAMGIEIEPLWDEQLRLNVHEEPPWVRGVDAVLLRTLSLNRALPIARGLERFGIPCINSARTLALCGDKWRTSLALAENNVPTPSTHLATSTETALEAADELGYPVVTKPLQGSWARGVARCSDTHALEGVLDQREQFAHPIHHQHYLQGYVDKPGRDIRAFLAGDEVLCAIYRESDHWITNTARGGEATNCPLTPDLEHLVRQAGTAVGGGVLAVDLMETSDGLVVHEVNATMEFRNSIEPTGVDIPTRVLEHVHESALDREVPA